MDLGANWERQVKHHPRLALVTLPLPLPLPLTLDAAAAADAWSVHTLRQRAGLFAHKAKTKVMVPILTQFKFSKRNTVK